ncbi:SURF1 family protein [Bartonella sp. A05]|uniref:SURF1 family protein n=1 Tax=Bartonella sp. A05 TaxID=2967261 RepID=UPI0022A99AF5|nr:SURF1 family protein [Bartonella sp. A05]MCZ2203582.1 SURF1 family protein [Bartonella sp. A05]
MNKMNDSSTKRSSKHINFFSILFGIVCVFFFLVFSALGIWQVQRLNWKTNLIANAHQRIHLSPVDAPPQTQWAYVTFDKDEYRPITITGKLLTNKNIFVTAVAQNTTGYWVLTPLQTADNALTFVNRGFIPMDARHHFQKENTPPQTDLLDHQPDTDMKQTTIVGLLRMSEKNGFFPRKNNPDKNLWYTRQLPAMAQKLGLSTVAPYFIDANKPTNPQSNLPIAGLTVVQFPNNHLTYAITWFILAAGILAASLFLLLHKAEKDT